MYDMYPTAWSLDDAAMGGAAERPRRRPRKEHSVLPPVIARCQQAAELRRQAA